MHMTTSSNSLMDCLKRVRPIEPEIFAEAERAAENTNTPLEQLLIQQGIVSDIDMVLATAEYLDLRPISLASFSVNPDLFELMPKERWKEMKA
ncbi:MAG: hypothetical protein OES84_01895, partial [Kiritimatiellaceae bacterium]|nr:hypothetical protein [Kiritimatiellaceae bacterium]